MSWPGLRASDWDEHTQAQLDYETERARFEAWSKEPVETMDDSRRVREWYSGLTFEEAQNMLRSLDEQQKK